MSAVPLKVLGLDHVVFRVSDMDHSISFYESVLGCAVERRLDALGLVQLRAGHSLIDLVGLDSPLGKAGGAGPGAEGRNVDHVCVRVEPFDEAALREHLAAHGVEPGEVGDRYGADGTGPSMYVRDPDGNVVELKGPPHTPPQVAPDS